MRPRHRSNPNRAGSSVIELLVVLAILLVVFSLALSAAQQVRLAAARLSCSANLRQLALALHNYHDTHRAFPSAVSTQSVPGGYSYLTWAARLLPFVEREDLWSRTVAAFDRQPNAFRQPPHAAAGIVINTYRCPLDPRLDTAYRFAEGVFAHTSYLGNSGRDGVTGDGILYQNSRVTLVHVSDGTSQTLLLGERPPSPDLLFGWWYAGVGLRNSGSADSHLGVRERPVTRGQTSGCAPAFSRFREGDLNQLCDVLHFWSLHARGGHFTFADGSVRFLTYDADAILPALATRAGGEVVAIP